MWTAEGSLRLLLGMLAFGGLKSAALPVVMGKIRGTEYHRAEAVVAPFVHGVVAGLA